MTLQVKQLSDMVMVTDRVISGSSVGDGGSVNHQRTADQTHWAACVVAGMAAATALLVATMGTIESALGAQTVAALTLHVSVALGVGALVAFVFATYRYLRH